MVLNEEQIIEILKINNAYWVHDGNPSSPHAELSNGQCSNAYFNLSKVLCIPTINENLARSLTLKLEDCFEKDYPECIVSSSYAAITFGYEVARMIGAEHFFAEKNCSHGFDFKRWTIPKNSIVLQIEELITSLNTARLVREAVERDNKYKLKFLPIIGTIVFRSPVLAENYFNTKIVSLLQKEVWSVPQDLCPLCKKGSKRYRPKENWGKLNKRD